MARLLVLQAFALVSLFAASQGQLDSAISRLCNTATRCSDCIIANPLCVWCTDPNFNGTSRCYQNNDPANICDPLFVQNPEGSFTNTDVPTLGGTIQVSPAAVDVEVRPGAPVDFELTVQPANNFPVDIYLLMDLSFSMNDDLANLKRLGAELAQEITMISTNFRVGFGSFVEKTLAPFVSLDPILQNDPCPNDDRFDCVATYSYRHHISLTANENDFNAEVQAQTISGNQDSPEGGFDGFLQSIVCTELIGWRDVSRKLLLFITDAGFHIAGDGKLGGVILPNDGSCRMTSPNVPQDYNEWNMYDYPSIGQIAEALRDNDIIPIFAAQQAALPAYQSLVRELGEGAFSGTLDRDSGNIVELVRDSYNNISQRIVFDTQLVPPGVSVNITATGCPGDIVNGVCTGVQIENNATFSVAVTLQQCIPENSGTTQVPIRVVGFGSFTLNLATVCNCDCENTMVDNSPLCNSNGTQTCGRCECNPGRFGELCQCDGTGQQGVMQDCPTGPTEVQCTSSDRGTCVCGECQCRSDSVGPLYFGSACECDREGCPSSNGELCSGRGVCTCDGCRCSVEPNTQQLYTGDACECTPDTDCVDPTNSTDMCNGRGTCGCTGSCDCPPPYFGDYCELCSGDEICLELTCQSNVECARCAVDLINSFTMAVTEAEFFSAGNAFPNGTMLGFDDMTSTNQIALPAGYCPEDCLPNVVIINATTDVNYVIQDEMALRCEFVDINGCIYRYFVGVNEDTAEFTDVHVEFRSFCPPNVGATAAWIVAVALIVALLVAAIVAIILLKVFLVIIDIIEVRKFEKDLASTKYSKNTNPLYRSATQDYKNPIYGQ